MSIITNLLKYALKVILFSWLVIFFAVPLTSEIYERSLDKDPATVKELAPYTRPLKMPDGSRYCSSSSINYKGHIVTLTNNHCCDYGNGMFGYNEVRVGDSIEEILYQDDYADICILTSVQKDTPIRLAEREFDFLDPLLLMGYPRGDFLAPRAGHMVVLNEEVCVRYTDGLKCIESNYISTISYGGNSGSPVFNSRSEVVNVLYAGNPYINSFGITVPYILVRNALDKYVRIYDKQERL